jgi:putative endonuclease
MKTQRKGERGEDQAVAHLEERGLVVVERNWRAGNAQRGELDIIARDGKTLCFIEVKARTSTLLGQPQEAVTPAKQRQISRLANAYVSNHNLDDVPCRFDVIEVWLSPHEATPGRIQWHKGAFDYCAAVAPRGARIF